MEQKSLEDQLKEKQKEIDELRKKLADRNPAFNGNLLKRADRKFNELCTAVGKSMQQTLGQEYTYAFKSICFKLEYDSGCSTNRGWVVYVLNGEDRKKIVDNIADIEMKKFQESMDNFSWAVKNQ